MNASVQSASTTKTSAQELHDRAFASFKTVVPDSDRWLTTQPESSPRISPLTGLALPSAKETPAQNLGQLFSAAKDAQEYWAAQRIFMRALPLRKFEALMWRYQEEILDVIQWETGKARKHAFEELLDVSQNIGFVTGKGKRILRDRMGFGALPFLSTARTAFLPVGVVGVIGPWNYPFTLAISDAAAALIAGNTIVFKPASQTPLSAIIVRSLLSRAGIPPGVFELALGSGSALGPAIVDLSDYIMFTGSTQVGQGIAEACGKRLIGCSAELGGKNPSIVFPDADLEKWAKTAVRECFSSTGQLCVSIERIYIHEKVWDQALELLTAQVESLVPGRDFSWETDFGPLVSPSQFKIVKSQVDDAVAKGARVVTGGHPLPELGPTGYQPTLLTGVTDDMTVFAHETFGPVVSLYKWSTPPEVIRDANDTNYGLNGSVWCSDHLVAREIAAQIKVGSVSINEGYGATWGAVTAPIGGMNQSGLGRRHGAEGILKYTESQTVTTGPPSLDPWFGMSAQRWADTERLAIAVRNAAWRFLRP